MFSQLIKLLFHLDIIELWAKHFPFQFGQGRKRLEPLLALCWCLCQHWGDSPSSIVLVTTGRKLGKIKHFNVVSGRRA